MLYNHARQLVSQWSFGQESRCPLCETPLIPKRGDWVRWHWAHRPGEAARRGCPYSESAWHLAWKSVYACLGWQIEVPIMIQGQRFILDAMNPRTGRIREFVHSFSAGYAPKHRVLAHAGYDICWIFDAATACSLRMRHTRTLGMAQFLKPLALEYARGLTSLVHTHPGALCWPEPYLWKEWRENVWFPLAGERSDKVLDLFATEAQDPGCRDREIEARCHEMYTRLDRVLLPR